MLSIRRRDLKVSQGNLKNDWRVYYLAADAEIIHTTLPVGCVQDEHGHTKVTEIHYVVAGSIIAMIEDQEHRFEEGDVFGFPPGSVHRLSNGGPGEAKLVTIKVVTDGTSHTRDFQTDKVPPEPERPFEDRPFFGLRRQSDV